LTEIKENQNYFPKCVGTKYGRKSREKPINLSYKIFFTKY